LGRAPEVLYLERMGHGLPCHKQGEKFLKQLEAFLAQHLGPP
jgi:dipeptidyl aminopeptidase/acylaminoacyl peptidase